MEDSGTSPSFVLSLLPYEKRALSWIVSADEQVRSNLALIPDSDNLKRNMRIIFDNWAEALKVKKALRLVSEDLSSSTRASTGHILPLYPELKGEQFTRDVLEKGYRSLFGRLMAPWESNRRRSQIAQAQNLAFRDNLFSSSDAQQFLMSVSIVMNTNDLDSWKTLLAMTKNQPDKMVQWLLNVPRKLQLLDYEDVGFKILHIVRMYLVHLVRPHNTSALLELCNSHKDFESRFWAQYQELQRRISDRKKRFYTDTGILAQLNIPEHAEMILETEDDIGETVPGFEFNEVSLDRPSFLRKAFAYGHLDLLLPTDIQLISRTEFVQTLRSDKPPEHWLSNLLADVGDESVKVAILNPSLLLENRQTLFFSEPDVFESYLDQEELPLLTLERQIQTVLITNLPDNLMELMPSRFWEYWNDCALVLDEGEIKIAQTTLGFLFRKLTEMFSARAAHDYLRTSLNDHMEESQALRKILGDDYAAQYETYFLPFVESSRIKHVQYLSEGANGIVWSAVWDRPQINTFESLEVPIVLKQPKQLLRNNEEKSQFLNEMKLAYRGISGVPLNCVQFYGLTVLNIDSAQNLFLVFEHVTGGSIDEYLDANGEVLNWNDILDLFFGVARGVSELHARGIAHGDLHQGNILISRKPRHLSVEESENIKSLLIDIGRGQSLDIAGGFESADTLFLDNAKAQDIFDYGFLLKDLAQQWMARASVTTLPPLLVELITMCTCEVRQPTMREVVEIGEQWIFMNEVGVPMPAHIEDVEVWKSLQEKFTKSPYSATRSMPSARKTKPGKRNISAENLD